MKEFGLSDEIVEQIRGVLRGHPLVESAGIFGSRARGDYKDYSDIDIALHAPDMSLLDYMDLRAKLRRLPIIFKLDVVHVDECEKEELLEKIARDEKLIYRRN